MRLAESASVSKIRSSGITSAAGATSRNANAPCLRAHSWRALPKVIASRSASPGRSTAGNSSSVISLSIYLAFACDLAQCLSVPQDPRPERKRNDSARPYDPPRAYLQIPIPPDDLAYDAVPVSLRTICDDAVVHLDQIEHRGLPMFLADDSDGMAFLAQFDSSLDLGSVGAVKPLLVAYLADDQVMHLFADA